MGALEMCNAKATEGLLQSTPDETKICVTDATPVMSLPAIRALNVAI